MKHLILLLSFSAVAQSSETDSSLLGEPGIIGTIILGVMIFIIAVFIAIFRVISLLQKLQENRKIKNWEYLKDMIVNLEKEELLDILLLRETSNKININELKPPSLDNEINVKVK